jgi:hypothetical protein
MMLQYADRVPVVPQRHLKGFYRGPLGCSLPLLWWFGTLIISALVSAEKWALNTRRLGLKRTHTSITSKAMFSPSRSQSSQSMSVEHTWEYLLRFSKRLPKVVLTDTFIRLNAVIHFSLAQNYNRVPLAPVLIAVVVLETFKVPSDRCEEKFMVLVCDRMVQVLWKG